MKTSKKHFELFKKECEYWIDILKLDNWKIYYFHGGANEGAYATTMTKLVGHVISIYLSDYFYDEDFTDINFKIKETAKHEIIHVLLARLASCGNSRYVTEEEIVEAEEELVRKLEKII